MVGTEETTGKKGKKAGGGRVPFAGGNLPNSQEKVEGAIEKGAEFAAIPKGGGKDPLTDRWGPGYSRRKGRQKEGGRGGKRPRV